MPTLIESFFNNIDGIFTFTTYAFFVLYFIFKLAGVFANLWTYRSVGHLIAREAPEWLEEEGLVDTSCIEVSETGVKPYIPLKDVIEDAELEEVDIPKDLIVENGTAAADDVVAEDVAAEEDAAAEDTAVEETAATEEDEASEDASDAKATAE